MDNNFKVNVNKSQNFKLKSQQVEDLDLVTGSGSKYHLLYNSRSYKAELVHGNFNEKKYTITLNSNTYQIDISDALDLLIEKMGYGTNNTKKQDLIHAPMPGIIIGLNVEEGDTVKEGDKLLILEAMKMENALICPKDATVKSVNIEKGDAVEKGKLLIELE